MATLNVALHCKNSTKLFTTFLSAAVTNNTVDEYYQAYRDRNALLYIVVVLLFYSAGIIIGIIMYLKREKQEILEEKTYDDYMAFRSDPYRWARYYRMQRVLSKLNRVERDQRRKRNMLLKAKQQQPSCHSLASIKSSKSHDTGIHKMAELTLETPGVVIQIIPDTPPEGSAASSPADTGSEISETQPEGVKISRETMV